MKRLSIALKRFLRLALTSRRGAIGLVPMLVTGGTVLAAGGTFAAATLSSGNGAADDANKAVHEAIQNILATFDVRGNVVAIASSTGQDGKIGQIQFTVSLASPDGAVDLTPPSASPTNNGLAGLGSQNGIIVSYADKNQRVEDLYWTARPLGKNDGDLIMDGSELFLITVGSAKAGADGGNLVDALARPLSSDTVFSIEMKAAQGAVLVIQYRTPPNMKPVMNFGF